MDYMDTNNRVIGWTTQEAAEYLGVIPRFVVSLIKRKKIAARKFWPVWVVNPESAKEYKKAPKDKGGRPSKPSPSFTRSLGVEGKHKTENILGISNAKTGMKSS